MERFRRTNALAVFCTLTSVFLILYGCGGGGGDSAPAVTVPGAPSSVTANAGDNSVTLDWSPVAGATSYNIYIGTAPGVTKTTGVKVSGVRSPNVVSGLTNGTPYYFVVTAVNSAGESAESTEVFATPVAPSASFSQADLAGTWDVVSFTIGRFPGWWRGIGSVNGSGGVTITSALDSTGDTTVPPAGSIILTISSAGVVSESGTGGNSTFHGQMSSNKNLVIGTEFLVADNTATLRVLRKQTGTAFSGMDLASKTFTNHWLDTGADNTWGYAAGTTTLLGDVIITSRVYPSGPDSPPFPSPLDLVVSPTGIVTDLFGRSFYGLLTDDKKVIFYIATSGINSYEFGVFTITGQAYTSGDGEGTWNFNALRNAPNPGWAYGVTSIDSAGIGTYLSYTDSVGGATPANFSHVLSASGVITDPADATYNGQLSYNKDIAVHTNTNASGRYGLVIAFK